MKNTQKERDKRRNKIREEIISTSEATEILGFTRARLGQIVEDGRIIPIKRGTFLKDDILAFKEIRDKVRNKG